MAIRLSLSSETSLRSWGAGMGEGGSHHTGTSLLAARSWRAAPGAGCTELTAWCCPTSRREAPEGCGESTVLGERASWRGRRGSCSGTLHCSAGRCWSPAGLRAVTKKTNVRARQRASGSRGWAFGLEKQVLGPEEENLKPGEQDVALGRRIWAQRSVPGAKVKEGLGPEKV